MTRPTGAPVHVLPVDARGDHRPYASCPCRPVECHELTAGTSGRIVLVHRDTTPTRPTEYASAQP
jgi:hypothetical protein